MKIRKFTNPRFLQQIGRQLLTQLMVRFEHELNATPFQTRMLLPHDGIDDEAFFIKVALLASTPDTLPDSMLDALGAIEELSNATGQERIEKALRRANCCMVFAADSTHADIALQTWLAAPEIVARAHNEHTLARLTAFEYFDARERTDRSRSFHPPGADTMAVIKGDLDVWFAMHHRGNGITRIETHVSDGEHWFLIRHGDTFARTARVDQARTEILHYRPAKDDVVVYSPERDSLRIHAGTAGERELYRKTFGLRLFGDVSHFSDPNAYTLDPLIADGLDALSVHDCPDLDLVVLREVVVDGATRNNDVLVHKSDDVFALGHGTGDVRELWGGGLLQAVFDFHVAHDPKPWRVELRPPNVLKVARRGDIALVQEFLVKRGFRPAGAPEFAAHAE